MSYIAHAGRAFEAAELFRKICSNHKLADATLYYSYTYPYKILADRKFLNMGSLYKKIRTYFKENP